MTALALLATTNPDGSWSPGIGDPTSWGWAITAAYLVGGALCLRAWHVEREASASHPWLKPRLWLALGAGLLFLCINKQLDLQSLVTVVGRRMAKAQGWYEYHREVQVVFVALIATAASGAGLAMLWWVRRAWQRYLLALLGAAYLGAFVVIRAASFHHVDGLLFRTGAGPIVNRLLELGGILLVSVAAWRAAVTAARNP